MRRLQLGAGFHRPDGWLNSDFMPRYADTIFLDITAPFPFSDDTFDAILCEHLIEHVPYPAADRAVAECLRVLKPGGYLRIATPDLLKLLSLYEQPQSAIGSRYSRWIVETFVPFAPGPQPCYVVNNAFRNWGHEFLFDEAALMAMLTRHRFVDLKRQSPQSSSSRELAGVDFHGRCIGDADFNDFESMIVEARKPGGADTFVAAE
ncbi:MAG: class I SAM-dependent methyltransferase [Planctomycetaceae bacterium]